MESVVQKLYEDAVLEARDRFAHHPALRAALDPSMPPERLELFLICFCALGVKMTEPVESWIRRAGERCTAIGFDELGKALQAHARHEAGHHVMMIEDARTLIAARNARLRAHLSADALFATPATPGIRRYVELHEDVIVGTTPFSQIAIEYEIERLSVSFGGQFVHQCIGVLGKDALRGMSFLEEHVALDVGHTKFNEGQLARLLAASPDVASALVKAGSAALDAYAQFLADCLQMATTLQAGGSPPS